MSPDDSIKVIVDPDLLDLAKAYIEMRKSEVLELRFELVRGKFDKISTAAHKMKGVAGAYGFEDLTRMGGMLEEASQALDRDRCGAMLGEVERYLLRVVPVSA